MTKEEKQLIKRYMKSMEADRYKVSGSRALHPGYLCIHRPLKGWYCVGELQKVLNQLKFSDFIKAHESAKQGNMDQLRSDEFRYIKNDWSKC